MVVSIARQHEGETAEQELETAEQELETAEQELEALQRAVAEARRHSWTDPDPIEPELENFLAALTRTHESDAAERQPRRNSWREVLEDVG